MTPQEMAAAMDALMASYPNMKQLEDETIKAYSSELREFKLEDFRVSMSQHVRTSKFFPTISELLDGIDQACRKRIARRDHEDREERLALQAGQDAIVDPGSKVHRVIVGPNHQIFLDYLSGKRTFPEPDWAKRARERKAGQEAKGEDR